MKLETRSLMIPVVLIVINLAISVAYLLSGRLPNPTPAGFWYDGSVLSYASPWVVAFRMPMMAAVFIVGTLVGLKWDPVLKAEPKRRQGALGPITNMVLAGSCYVNLQFLSWASSPTSASTPHPYYLVLAGLLLIGFGNFVAKSGTNGFWGMRNRWTVQSEVVERQTNRLLGWLWVAGGLGFALGSPWAVLITRPYLDWLFGGYIVATLLVALFASYLMAGRLPAKVEISLDPRSIRDQGLN